MRLWIVCAAPSEVGWRKTCTGAEYAAALTESLEGEPALPEQRPLRAEGRFLCSPRAAARATAAHVLPGAEIETESRLDELPPPAGEGSRPLWLWRLRTRPRPEDRERARALAAELAEREEDAVLVTHPLFAAPLLEALRALGFCVRRSELGGVRPLERILVTRRDMHCGGCGHNCLLENPGCGVGRDRALRAGVKLRGE